MTASAVRRNGPYAPLGANYADDDAIATLDLAENDRAELLYLRGLAYCARDLRTEGYISDIALRAGKVLRRRPGKRNADTVLEAAETLADLGIWTREGDGYRVTAWLKWNKSWAEMDRRRATDRERKRTGAEADSETPPQTTGSDSARKGSGVLAPEHVTALHDTTQHGTAALRATAAGRSAPPAAAHTHPAAAALVAETGPTVPVVHERLVAQVAELLDAGTDIDAVRRGLVDWRSRVRPGPGLLPHLVQDQLDAGQTLDPRFAGLAEDARRHA